MFAFRRVVKDGHPVFTSSDTQPNESYSRYLVNFPLFPDVRNWENAICPVRSPKYINRCQ